MATETSEIPNKDEDFDKKARNSLSAGFIVSYMDSPSRVSIMDWNTHQFVLLKTRYGAVDSFLVGVTKSILEQLETVQNEIEITLLLAFSKKHGLSGLNSHPKRIKLMLRGIWFDDTHGNIVIHLELLHSELFGSEKKLSLDPEQITKKFSRNYAGQESIAKLTITPASMDSDWFSSLSDDYYVNTKKALFWVV